MAQREVNLHAVNVGHDADGVEHGDVLLAYSEAVFGEDEQALAAARHAVREVLGDAGLVDAAAVASNFQRMVRIADGSGITLGNMADFSAEVRAELDLERFVRDKSNLH